MDALHLDVLTIQHVTIIQKQMLMMVLVGTQLIVTITV